MKRYQMPDNKKMILMMAFILFQILILSWIYLGAQSPLWAGQEIKLRTRPVDPRSLFRGNYARLRYDISSIPFNDLKSAENPRQGEIVYIKLKKTDQDIYVYSGVDFKKPDTPFFIRGRIQAPSFRRSETYIVKYGIEAYFAPKEKALDLEKKLRDNAIATIMVCKNGKAALKEVHGFKE